MRNEKKIMGKKNELPVCGGLARAQWHSMHEKVGLQGARAPQLSSPRPSNTVASMGQSVTPKAGARVQEPRIRAIARSRVWVGGEL